MAESVAGGGGGTVSAFVFGFVLTNYRYVLKKLWIDRKLKVDKRRIVEFNEEISFLLKSYYFLYMGLIVKPSHRYLTIGFGVAIYLLVVRYAVATGVGRLMKFSREEMVISRLSFPLGTSTIVMSQLPRLYDPQGIVINTQIYTSLIFPVVLATVVFTAMSGPTLAKKELSKRQNQRE